MGRVSIERVLFLIGDDPATIELATLILERMRVERNARNDRARAEIASAEQHIVR